MTDASMLSNSSPLELYAVGRPLFPGLIIIMSGKFGLFTSALQAGIGSDICAFGE